MKMKLFAVATVVALLPLAAAAQNIATVNGKAVPKSRVDTLITQATRSGQQVGPEVQVQARDQVVLREIFAQEAEKRGIGATPEFRHQPAFRRPEALGPTPPCV